MTGSWFHVWALSDPAIVYADVTEKLYPTYITRDGARVLLEELDKNGSAGDIPPLSEVHGDFAFVDLVDPNPANSNQVFEKEVQVGQVTYTAGGYRVLDGDHPAGRAVQQEDRTYPTYVWSETAGRWLAYIHTDCLTCWADGGDAATPAPAE